MALSRMLREVVQRRPGVAVVGCAGALRPAREVVHGVGEHAERLPGRRVEVGEELVVVGGGSRLGERRAA